MNREIKFRTKCKDDGHWVYGNYLQAYNGQDWIEHDGDFFAVDAETVGQFTGLYDIHGKEIYEGDIVSYDDTPYCPSGKKYKGEVVVYRGAWCVEHYEAWCDEYFYTRLFSDDFANHKTVIIGNRYKNPELLKGGMQ